mmetsp:Transcript_17631/g.25734  ORF Transcript_17631/g.25734 Transcript_17631/m.25734 type:complete len:381 (-) Transcript_17631:200-1342(-)|eukprot:CAMPEP_0197240220 /NCGR_PEP_ID=MMETSP1429-20130617/6553_1 /TAXON_ID=49237 /ORGANISM="Chaetoceros  sp., Strain UNC1202" /LENGTH=380 /DNA_ID=CAMNT_0042699815 /DNA_START=50 /DNA_END=1192 /DNA_ORIENTATION=+
MVQINQSRRRARTTSPLITLIKFLFFVIILLSFLLIFHLLPTKQDHELDEAISKIISEHFGREVNIPDLRKDIYALIQATDTGSQRLSSAVTGSGRVTPNEGLGNAEDGWKTIDVFYGDHSHLNVKGGYSQCRQDRLVMGLLKHADMKNKGFFIDLAANHATSLSNTYHIEQDLDWNGICIEPNPQYWHSLSHRKCHVVGAVVGAEDSRMKEVKFRMYSDMKARAASGGIEEYLTNKKLPKSKERPERLFIVPISDILKKYNAPPVMEYLSLDIEGAEYDTMKGFPFDSHKFKVMTIERPSEKLTDLLYDKGYLYIGGNNEDGEETAWIHSDFENEIDFGAFKEVEWFGGGGSDGKSTKWMTLDEKDPLRNKPKVNDFRI